MCAITGCVTAALGGWLEEAKLLASDGAEDDIFGVSVSIDGDTAVIGAYGDDDNGPGSGSAYVFRHDGNASVEEAKLLASDGGWGDCFGISVAISGGTAVIGAHGGDDNGDNSGSAYVFRHDGTGWVEEAKLLASDGEEGDLLGWSVSISADIAVIGAWRDDDNGEYSGSAYVFRRVGSNWVEEAKLLASDGAAEDWFGYSVSISGDAAVIGAHGGDDSGDNSGSAYVFRHDGSGWVEEAKLLASDGAEDDRFGRSVSISEDTAVIGVPQDRDNGWYSGSAYIFRYSPYCAATSLYCALYISHVEVGEIDNTSECENYADFTDISTEMVIGNPYEMIITITDGHASNEGAVWIDWNQDADFYEDGELIALEGSPGQGPYTASVVPPADAVLGETRMRIRLLWFDPIDPCGTTDYGEVEDYAVIVVEGSSCPADLGGDGDVDTADLLLLLGAWGTPDGDVDGDGDTDTSDLLALLAAWGECP
jgi:hypothetical protein